MKILFSPVGGTDPIRGGRDGSMLHICRHYQPDKVVLFMTKEMCGYDEADNRYEYCIEKLGKLQGHTYEVKKEKHPELNNPSSWELFYQDFKQILGQLRKELGQGGELLINVASGTPAMKSALTMLSAIDEYLLKPIKVIQVTTPAKAMNVNNEDHNHYEVEIQWECDEDNKAEAKNRCKEIENHGLVKEIYLEMIRSQIRNYNYQAAYDIAQIIKDDLTDRQMKLIELGLRRNQLKIEKVRELSHSLKINVLPERGAEEEEEKNTLLEYLLLVGLKLRRGEYADYLRALTPAILALMRAALENERICRISDFVEIDSYGREKIMKNKIAPEILAELDKRFQPNRMKDGCDLSSQILQTIIDRFSQQTELKECARDLLNVEQGLRHPVAHSIKAVNNSDIRDRSGFNADEIYEKMKRLAVIGGITTDEKTWKSYDRMNDLLCRELY